MISSLQVPISETFGLTNQQWGLINSGVFIVATMVYPIWGFHYDRSANAKLLSLASLIILARNDMDEYDCANIWGISSEARIYAD